jgi:spermidine dehydrogenase
MIGAHVSSVASAMSNERDLGMHNSITRRDFLQGIAVGAGVLTAPLSSCGQGPEAALAAQDLAGYYPPALTGLRGSHPGSFESAHAVRDGWRLEQATDSREHYDLVVVGAGISGLAAAYFYRTRVPHSRILLLDNHDDFGGHAKRNEFDLGGRIALMNGGTLRIESPRPYGSVAAGLLRELGIDVEALANTIQNVDYYPSSGLKAAAFLDQETFGADSLVRGEGDESNGTFDFSDSSLPERIKREFLRLQGRGVDYMPGLSSQQKKERLAGISYERYLKEVLKLDPLVLAFYQVRTHADWGVGIDAVSALDGWGFGLAGFAGLNLEPGSIPRMGFTPTGYVETGGSTKVQFPDGNATIARLLVRKLIPTSMSGSTVEDVIGARTDYAQLDRADSATRLRLSATAVKVVNGTSAAGGPGVTVTYVRNGKLTSVHGRDCVLACYNMMIPYLCPEVPPAQRQALHSLVKTPLVYTSVAIRSGRAFHALKVNNVYVPSGYFTWFGLVPFSKIGRYETAQSPDEPTLLRMIRTPCQPGLTEDEQHRVGRADLLGTSFETFERHVRSQLGRILGPGGFDPARDITAITVNRWPHGYAHEYNPLFDADVPEAERPYVIGRARVGHIAIANSDAGGGAYTDVAIEQAHRAVSELTTI